MDEAAAREWAVASFDVPRETLEKLELLVDLLKAENQLQNLVSKPSLDQIWNRHIADSAQLLLHAKSPGASWLDLGTGAGFPGLVVALLHQGPVTLVESRRLRADFLRRAAAAMAINPTILCSNAERVPAQAFEVISARAFAPLDKLFTIAERFATPNTRWVLPKGRNAKSELEAAESLWQGEFRLEPSVTDPEALILVAQQVRRKHKGKRGR